MISVNELIQNAFQRVGIVGDCESVSPTQAMAGVKDLQDVVTQLNVEDYLLENYVTYDANVAKKITFARQPENWYEVEDESEIDTRIANNEVAVGDIFKIKNESKFYVIRYHVVDDVGEFYKMTDTDWNTYLHERILANILC